MYVTDEGRLVSIRVGDRSRVRLYPVPAFVAGRYRARGQVVAHPDYFVIAGSGGQQLGGIRKDPKHPVVIVRGGKLSCRQLGDLPGSRGRLRSTARVIKGGQ